MKRHEKSRDGGFERGGKKAEVMKHEAWFYEYGIYGSGRVVVG